MDIEIKEIKAEVKQNVTRKKIVIIYNINIRKFVINHENQSN